jgi:hypothetical protein
MSLEQWNNCYSFESYLRKYKGDKVADEYREKYMKEFLEIHNMIKLEKEIKEAKQLLEKNGYKVNYIEEQWEGSWEVTFRACNEDFLEFIASREGYKKADAVRINAKEIMKVLKRFGLIKDSCIIDAVTGEVC